MPSLLTGWATFYTIVGSSSAALIGLQFVVMALIADSDRPGSQKEIDAWGSPTIVHFSVVLLLSAVLAAPWDSLTGPRMGVVLIGAAGLLYGAVVVQRARRQTGYVPVLEDWIFHIVLPFVAYLSLFVAGVRMDASPAAMLFVVAAVSLLLLYIAIHNAWDTVTYVALQTKEARAKRAEAAAKAPKPEDSRRKR